MAKHTWQQQLESRSEVHVKKDPIPIAEALIRPEVAEGMPENITLKRQHAKAAHDKYARPLPAPSRRTSTSSTS